MKQNVHQIQHLLQYEMKTDVFKECIKVQYLRVYKPQFFDKNLLQNRGAAYTRNLKNNPDPPRKSRCHVDD
jgi:hypothetical protein